MLFSVDRALGERLCTDALSRKQTCLFPSTNQQNNWFLQPDFLYLFLGVVIRWDFAKIAQVGSGN